MLVQPCQTFIIFLVPAFLSVQTLQSMEISKLYFSIPDVTWPHSTYILGEQFNLSQSKSLQSRRGASVTVVLGTIPLDC